MKIKILLVYLLGFCMTETLLYNIAITLLPRSGDVVSKTLISYCGSAEAFFREKKSKLLKIPGIGQIIAEALKDERAVKQALKRAEIEMGFISENNIQAIFYTDEAYPKRLKNCHDNPAMIYYKGTADLNASRMICIVGTRNATEYGKSQCEKLVRELAGLGVIIVSGLAYGIDIIAHKVAVLNKIPTIGVLAHGLDIVYPSVHKSTAEKMLEYGGLLTDFVSEKNPDKENFPKRNRIVAGMTDATVVIESGLEGGSMITADIANSYHRDVFAFPGKVDEHYSKGCNFLIKKNKAALVESAKDIVELLGWEEVKRKKATMQKQLFIELKPEEESLVNVLQKKEQMTIDDLCYASGFNMSKVSTLLLGLEFNGVVKSLPGKMYRLI